MKFRVIIPARLGSTRLPNKPLKEIEGKTLIQRVVEQAKKSNAESVHVATDSKEIENHCKQLDVESLMTNSNHQTGSDRLAESCNILELNDDELSHTDFLYEPSKDRIVKSLIPRYLNAQIWKYLLESYASEQAARMVAMENATTNSEDMIKNLTLEFNKARQAAITTEMLEIVSGAEALKE